MAAPVPEAGVLPAGAQFLRPQVLVHFLHPAALGKTRAFFPRQAFTSCYLSWPTLTEREVIAEHEKVNLALCHLVARSLSSGKHRVRAS
ncbi:hypothetical protein [Desulfothermobacter acidiphilus]|uniref:hypothetical protein n=1 Tax=Desulfothermobacter acidiphilus TaxID=1938353 RepID=UPI003F8C34EB